MPSYLPKQPKRERGQISIKLDRDVLRKLEQYGRFLESSRDYIINTALKLVFRKDKSFSAWLETEQASGAAADSRSRTGHDTRQDNRIGTSLQVRIRRPKVMRTLIDNRTLLSLALSCSIGIVLYRRFPFPDEHPLLGLVLVHRPYIFWAIRNAYVAMLFSTPLIGVSMFFSLLYIFVVRQQHSIAGNRLPLYPDPRLRQSLFLVVGELHNPKRPEPAEHPRWLTIPDRGLCGGRIGRSLSLQPAAQ